MMDPVILVLGLGALAVYLASQPGGPLSSSRAPGPLHTAVPQTPVYDPITQSQTNPNGPSGGGGGVSGAAALAALSNPIIAGIVAGGAALTWGVSVKGWFRGGEEGVAVNPARDQYLLEFGAPGTSSPFDTAAGSGFSNLAVVLTGVTMQPDGSQYFRALTQADTMRKFEAAVRDIDAVLLNGAPERGIPPITDTATFRAVLDMVTGKRPYLAPM